ncbi:MAG: PAS domain-containing protein, partial [Burkholderiaceae bacterium]
MRSTRLAQLFDNAATLMALLDGAEHRVDISNARYRAVIGKNRLPGSAELLTRVLQSGEPAAERCASALHCIDFLYQPVRNELGQITGVFVEGTEVTERAQAETLLRESQTHFKAALSAGRMGSWETDHRSKTRQWSEEGMALFGLQLPGGRGKVDGPDDEYVAAIHPDDRHLVQRFRQLAAELDSFPAEYRVVRPDGSILGLSGRGLVVERGPAGQPLRVVSIMADATDRKVVEEQLRTERERLGLALNAGQMGAYDYDVVADRLWWSPETYALFGVHPAEFVPTPESVIGLLHPEDRARFLSSRAEAQARKQPLAIEFRIVRPDGRTAWLAHRGQMDYDARGRAVRSFGISMEVTEARQSAEQLRALTDRLSDADRRKDEFLATLAHELRNPLAPVRNSLELMKRAGSDVQAMQALRVTIERQMGQMVRLIDDLLDVGRITSNKLELQREPVELGAIVRQAIETSSPLVTAAGHQLHFEPAAEPIALHADPVRLNQVFTNLIVNAAKFTP